MQACIIIHSGTCANLVATIAIATGTHCIWDELCYRRRSLKIYAVLERWAWYSTVYVFAKLNGLVEKPPLQLHLSTMHYNLVCYHNSDFRTYHQGEVDGANSVILPQARPSGLLAEHKDACLVISEHLLITGDVQDGLVTSLPEIQIRQNWKGKYY